MKSNILDLILELEISGRWEEVGKAMFIKDKLISIDAYLDKLSETLRYNKPIALTLAHREVRELLCKKDM